MKVIDLLNKIANGEELPNKIKYHDLEYTKGKIKEFDTLLSYNHIDFCEFVRARELNDEVEIIEEEPEIDIQGIEELDYVEDYEADETDIKLNRDKIRELIKAVKQLDNKIKEKE